MTTPRTRRASGTRQHTNGRQPMSVPPASDTRTRLIRFRLNPRSSSDQQILAWLLQHAPYYRADAIRTALLTHILRRTAASELAVGASSLVNTSTAPPATGTSASTVQKLEKLFPS